MAATKRLSRKAKPARKQPVAASPALGWFGVWVGGAGSALGLLADGWEHRTSVGAHGLLLPQTPAHVTVLLSIMLLAAGACWLLITQFRSSKSYRYLLLALLVPLLLLLALQQSILSDTETMNIRTDPSRPVFIPVVPSSKPGTR